MLPRCVLAGLSPHEGFAAPPLQHALVLLNAGLGSPAVPGLHLWPLHIPGEHIGLSQARGLLCAAMHDAAYWGASHGGSPVVVYLCMMGVTQLPALLHSFPDSTALVQPPSHELQDGLARNIPTWHSLWLTFAGEPLCGNELQSVAPTHLLWSRWFN